MDFRKLAESIGFDEDEYLEFIGMFLKTTNATLQKLQSAIENENMPGVIEAAHSIKGASVNLGLLDIFGLAKEIEEEARENKLEVAAEGVKSIQEKCDQVAGKLQTLSRQQSESKGFGETKQKKILVVDNQPEMLKFVVKLLEEKSYKVLTAEDGLSALEVLKNYVPDVIFVDLIMPNITGDKLCQIIRGMPILKDVKIIILSAIAREDKIKFTEFGADACIAKGPFNKMADHILRVLGELEKGTAREWSEKMIGIEDVYPRTVARELLSIKKHLEVVLGSMAEGILELGFAGRIVYANASALFLIGLSEEKVLGSPFAELFQGTDYQRIRNLLERMDSTPLTISPDSPVLLNGKEISMNVVPIRDEAHQPMIVILTDVTKQRQIELRLRHA